MKNYSLDLVIRQIVRDIINEMVKDLIITTQKNIKKYKIKKLEDVYSLHPIVAFSNQMKKFDDRIKSFKKKNVLS